MSPNRIDQISATCFRGATTKTKIAFNASKKIAFLFGENGTGKSTIIDAIDAVCNQCVGSLDDRNVTYSGSLHSIGKKPKDVVITLTAGSQTWTATLKGSDFIVSPTDKPPCASILRRGRILKLVTAQPAERYKELRGFIDVECVEKSESGLNDAIKEAKRKSTDASRKIAEAEERLTKAYETDHTPEEDGLTPIEWAKRRTQSDFNVIKKRLDIYDTIINGCVGIETLISQKDNARAASEEKKGILKQAEEKKKDPSLLNVETGMALASLLNQAKDYLEKAPDLDKCPVCQKSSNATELAESIAAQLTQCSKLTSLMSEIKTAQENYSAAKNLAIQAYIRLIDAVILLQPQLAKLDEADLQSLVPDLTTFPHLKAWAKKLDNKEAVNEIERYITAILPLQSMVKERQKALKPQVDQLSPIKRDYDVYVSLFKEAEHQIRVQQVLEKMQKIVHDRRIAFTQGILDQVADECDRLYATIHPNEGLGKVRFLMDEVKKASMSQLGHFAGHDDVKPEVYFSDSHLDTLGFCLFLAVTKYTTDGKSLVVLDDVFTTVDMGHIKRILPMLIREAEQYPQFVFATHQRRWLELLRIGVAPADKVDLIQLRPWGLDAGINCDRVDTHLNELKKTLETYPLDRQRIGSKASFLLEAVAGEMKGHLGGSIQCNPYDKYTLSDLMGSLIKPRKKVKVRRMSLAAPPAGGGAVLMEPPNLHELASDLKSRIDVRNIVSDHFNWDAADILDNEVLEYGKKALEFARLLTCDKCGAMATRKKEGHLECPCKELRLEFTS